MLQLASIIAAKPFAAQGNEIAVCTESRIFAMHPPHKLSGDISVEEIQTVEYYVNRRNLHLGESA
jgi:hypothetical protein